MKRLSLMILVLSFFLGLMPKAEEPKIKVMMNGEYISFQHSPVKINGRVMVPLRGVFETFGAVLSYDKDTMLIKVTQGKRRVVMSPDKPQAIYEYGNYKRTYKLDVPPTNVNSVTYVPVRFAAEAFGMKVDWDADENTVVLINLIPIWRKFQEGAPTLYNGFFNPTPMSDKSLLTGKTDVKYIVYSKDDGSSNSFGFHIDTQGYSDGKSERKDSYVGIEARGKSFEGIPIPANVNFSTLLKGSQYYIRTDLWSSMNNLSIVKKYDSMWIKAGAEGSEQIPFYIMFGLNLKKLIDAYIKDTAFRADVNTYDYLNSVVDGIIALEKDEISLKRENGGRVTLIDYKKEGLNSMSAQGGSSNKKVGVELFAKKTAREGERIEDTFKLRITVPDVFDFIYGNTLESKVNNDIPEIEGVADTQIAKYDDISDALKLAELLIKIIK